LLGLPNGMHRFAGAHECQQTGGTRWLDVSLDQRQAASWRGACVPAYLLQTALRRAAVPVSTGGVTCFLR